MAGRFVATACDYKGNVVSAVLRFYSKRYSRDCRGLIKTSSAVYPWDAYSHYLGIGSTGDEAGLFLVLPWQLKAEILELEKEYLASGGKMIFPLKMDPMYCRKLLTLLLVAVRVDLGSGDDKA